jgi:hypothetical protein
VSGRGATIGAMWSKEHAIWLFVLACGLVLGWFGAVHPLLLADEGAEVRLYLKAAIAAPVAIVYGLLYVLRFDSL